MDQDRQKKTTERKEKRERDECVVLRQRKSKSESECAKVRQTPSFRTHFCPEMALNFGKRF